jgi:hypothetical protein
MKKLKLKHRLKPPVIILIVVVLVFLGVAATLIVLRNTNTEKGQEQGRYASTQESSFLYNEIYYKCSKPISGKWGEHSVGWSGGQGWYFFPDSQEDLEKYCRMTAVIEYRAVLDILRRPDVSATIAKYDTTQAWVRALGHDYIHDKAYLDRILPAYSDMKIDCIIVVHSPEGTRFFIENGEVHKSHDDHQYMEVPAAEFLESLNNAPAADVTAFWVALH